MTGSVALTQILILFSVLIAGIVIKKAGFLKEDAEDTMSVLIVKLGLPCMILASTNLPRTNQAVYDLYILLGLSAAYYLLSMLLGVTLAKILRLKHDSATVFASLITFANIGFMGIPVAKAFWGEIGVFYTSIVNLIFTLTLWTLGVLLFNKKEKLVFKKLFNAGTVAAITAIIMFSLGYRFPSIVYSALNTAGQLTVPVSMIMIGSLIAERNILKVFSDYRLLIVSLLRLLIIPIITCIILHQLKVSVLVLNVFTVLSAMPSAALNAVFAREYNSDSIMASEGIFLTTFLSVFTLPVIVIFINWYIGYFVK